MLNDAQICRDDIISWGKKCRMFFGTLIFSSHYFYRHSLAKKDGKADNFIAHMNDFSNYAKEILGVKGAAEIISSSCSSGTTAAGMALDYIRAGLCKSLSGSICNPFDENRDGINIGECGALFLFESLEHAKISAADIDYINAHGTGTLINDYMETKAIEK